LVLADGLGSRIPASTWLRLIATLSASNDAITYRGIDTDPNNCPDSDA